MHFIYKQLERKENCMKGSRIIVSTSCSLFNGVSEIKFPEEKYGHPLFYLYFVSNICEYAKTTFQFINIIIEDTREQKYLIVHQYSNIKDGSKKSCDKHRNHVLPNLCGAGGHQTGIDI